LILHREITPLLSNCLVEPLSRSLEPLFTPYGKYFTANAIYLVFRFIDILLIVELLHLQGFIVNNITKKLFFL